MRVVGTAGAGAAAKPAHGYSVDPAGAARAAPLSLLRVLTVERGAGRPPDDKRGPGPFGRARGTDPQLSETDRRIRATKIKTNQT